MPDLIMDYPIADVTPADYNPRHLSDEAFDRLKDSLQTYGVIKPVILNKNGTIVAGHQRTKALEEIGEDTVVAIVLDKIASTHDEVQFNLIHNSIETAGSDVRVPTSNDVNLYEWVEWDDIDCAEIGKVNTVQSCATLIAGYGPWGSVIAHPETGAVMANSDYAVACNRQRVPLLVYYADPADISTLAKVMNDDFGVYDVETVVRHSWQQFAIQPIRHGGRKSGTGRAYQSTLYSRHVEPEHRDEDRIVDFGAGRMAYVLGLADAGWDILGYEPFLTKAKGKDVGGRDFDLPLIVGHIRAIEKAVRQRGLFNVVIADSVINAAINTDYHEWITVASWALCDADGRAYFATRNLKTANDAMKSKTRGATGGRTWYLTPDNHSISMRLGQWTTIKYHSAESLHEHLSRFFEEVEIREPNDGNLKAVCRFPKKHSEAAVRKALEEEWNPPYPGDVHHDRHHGLVEALLKRLREQGRLSR